MVSLMDPSLMGRLFAASVIALGLGLAGPAAANSYLDALKAEAASDIQPKAMQPAPRDGRPTPRTDDQIQMEQWLQQEFVGSYVFYQRLSDPKKMAVYRLYREGAPIEEIRAKINDLLKQ